MKINAPKYHRGGQYPVEIEAFQYTGKNGSEIELWLGFHCMTSLNTVLRLGGNVPEDYRLTIPGAGTAKGGDYIVKNLDDSVVILEAKYFEQEFKKVEEASPNLDALSFLKKFAKGHRIVSTDDLTEFQISEARIEGRLYVESGERLNLGWVALPWELTTPKDRNRERGYFTNKEKVDL